MNMRRWWMLLLAGPLLPILAIIMTVTLIITMIAGGAGGIHEGWTIANGQECDDAKAGVDTSTASADWVQKAVDIANDDSHGYDQTSRTLNPDTDCSYLVWWVLKQSGLDVGDQPFNTHSMEGPLTHAGFVKHSWDGRDASQLSPGDLISKSEHVEIYMGSGQWIGAHSNERHGITGGQPGDQTGHEISVETHPTSNSDTYWHYTGSTGVQQVAQTPQTGQASQAGKPGVVGWRENDAKARFSGLEGPNNVCGPYATGQCTWWACMREHMLGHTTGSYWGNGEKWVRSAIANGWVAGLVAPGAVVSFTPGSRDTYADGSQSHGTHSASAGHVAVIESVDTGAHTFTTSEKGGGIAVYTHTYSYQPLPSNMSVAAPPGTSGDTAVGGSTGDVQPAATPGQDGTVSCSARSTVDGTVLAQSTGRPDGTHASPEQAKQIARQLLPQVFPGATEDDYQTIVWIWEHESGWRWDAENPSSHSYGIPQSLPGDKMAQYGADWHDNASTQIMWGLNYIKERYGTVAQAKAFWQAHHWY